MHEYYAKNKDKFKKGLHQFMGYIKPELEKISSKTFAEIEDEIWNYYEKNLLERFPYVGGDKVSGTKNLTGAYCFVAMGEVLKRYGFSIDEIGHLMVLSYERNFQKLPRIVKVVMGKAFTSPKLLNKMLIKKDKKNEDNAKINPGSFETRTQIPPEEYQQNLLYCFSDGDRQMCQGDNYV